MNAKLFTVTGAAVARFTAAPLLRFQTQIAFPPPPRAEVRQRTALGEPEVSVQVIEVKVTTRPTGEGSDWDFVAVPEVCVPEERVSVTAVESASPSISSKYSVPGIPVAAISLIPSLNTLKLATGTY
jgi:hypothetical protein